MPNRGGRDLPKPARRAHEGCALRPRALGLRIQRIRRARDCRTTFERLFGRSIAQLRSSCSTPSSGPCRARSKSGGSPQWWIPPLARAEFDRRSSFSSDRRSITIAPVGAFLSAAQVQRPSRFQSTSSCGRGFASSVAMEKGTHTVWSTGLARSSPLHMKSAVPHTKGGRPWNARTSTERILPVFLARAPVASVIASCSLSEQNYSTCADRLSGLELHSTSLHFDHGQFGVRGGRVGGQHTARSSYPALCSYRARAETRALDGGERISNVDLLLSGVKCSECAGGSSGTLSISRSAAASANGSLGRRGWRQLLPGRMIAEAPAQRLASTCAIWVLAPVVVLATMLVHAPAHAQDPTSVSANSNTRFAARVDAEGNPRDTAGRIEIRAEKQQSKLALSQAATPSEASGLESEGSKRPSAANRETPAGPPQAGATSPSPQQRRNTKKKVIALDGDFVVEGQLDKPSAFFVFRRSAMNFDWPRLSVRLRPLISAAARDPAFTAPLH